jgi:hypothetical protein
MGTHAAPPPVLDMARVIAYAFVDGSVQWTGRQTLFVNKEKLGPVPRLALCQNVSGDLRDILVFHCNEEWDVLGVSGADTLEAAKASVERAYGGITAKWIETGVTEEAAIAWMREHTKDMSCSFCDRVPGDFEQLIESKSGTVRVCNYCVDDHYKAVHHAADNTNAA